jgi:hypothetical protein
MSKPEGNEGKKKTLAPDEIVSERRFGRREALAMVGGGVLVGAAATVLGQIGASHAHAEEGVEGGEALQTDSDSGPHADAAGRGRTGRTDSDSGPNADRAGHGRARCSDSDSGRYADPAGGGRYCR